MRLASVNHLAALGAVVGVLACGGDSGGGTGPCTPGPATQLTKSGDQQNWYFNNQLPKPLTVTALDVSQCPVPGVVVNWAVTTGGGSVNPSQSSTNASGMAATTHTLGPPGNTTQIVTATPTAAGLSAVSFTEFARAPATTGAVDLVNTSFSPKDTVVQVNGTVTWTWKDQPTPHNVTFQSGPAPLPAASATQSTNGSTFAVTFTKVGTYTYECTVHPVQMTGSVTVVN